MKLINNIVNKIGWDKIVHFLVAYLIVDLFYIFSLSIDIATLGVIVACILTLVKEFVLDTDTKSDFNDMCYSYVGAFASYIIIVLSLII